MVLALSSLLLPLAVPMDVRPFLTAEVHTSSPHAPCIAPCLPQYRQRPSACVCVCALQDPDLPLIAEQAARKRRAHSGASSPPDPAAMGSTIVGITDSSILSQLDEAFSAALFLSPTVPTIHTYQAQPFSASSQKPGGQFIEKAISAAMKSKAGAATVTLAPAGGSKASYSLAKKSHAHLSSSFRHWAVDGCKLSQLVVRHEPTGYNISKLLLKVKRLPFKDRVLLGDMLLRDNLRDLTLGFFRSEDDDRGAARTSTGDTLAGPTTSR